MNVNKLEAPGSQQCCVSREPRAGNKYVLVLGSPLCGVLEDELPFDLFVLLVAAV